MVSLWSVSTNSLPSSNNRTFRSALLCVLISILTFTCHGQMQTHNVLWTPEGVRRYNATHPLLVNLRDILNLQCQRLGNYNYSNAWVHRDIEQYRQCSCAAVASAPCHRIGSCAPEIGTGSIELRVNNDGADLDTISSYTAGRVYYLVSYSTNTLQSALGEEKTGGQCVEGLKLAFAVAPLPSEPSNTRPPPPGSGITSPSDILPSVTDPYGSGEVSSSLIPQVTSVPNTGLTAPFVFQDWHIAVIAVLGGIVLILLVSGIVVICLVVARSRRKRKTADISNGKQDMGQIQSIFPNNAEVQYPVENFKDPIDEVGTTSTFGRR